MEIEVVTRKDLQAFRQELLQDLLQLLQAHKKDGKTEPVKQWLKNREVCALLRISPATLQRLRISGKLKASKVGGIHYYRYSDLTALLNRGVSDT